LQNLGELGGTVQSISAHWLVMRFLM